DTSRGTSENTKFAKQSILEKPPNVGETHALSKPVTSNLIPTPQGSKVVRDVKVIVLGTFRINPFKPSKEQKHVPYKVRASVRTNPITVLQPPVITKKVVNSDSNGLSSTGVDNTKTKRPYPRSNTKNDRATYKNLFDSISVSRVQTETKIASLQNELQCNIYKNAKLITQLFKKVSDQKDNNQDTSKNTKFAKQPNVEILPKISKTYALSKPVTSNSVSTPPVSKGVNNGKVIAPGMFRISPDTVSREAKKVPNTVSASYRTKPITVSQPSVITKKDMNSNLNGLSSIGLDNTKTRRPQPRSNTKNDRVPSTSKSSRSKNKEVKVEEHHRNLLLSKKNKHISSTCINSKIDSQDVISKVVCVVCKKCLNSINHDVCLNSCVNGKKSRGRKHKANVSKNETQQKIQPEIKKPKKVGFIKRLATPKPRKPRFLLRWSSTGKMFNQDGKLVTSSNSESHVDCSNGDNACTSNSMKPKIKRFPNSTSLLGRMEAIRIFLVYAAHKSFTVFQMDVKTTFFHGSLKEDMYVCQPEGGHQLADCLTKMAI
nr:putative ribonuclease H-like domain-containing protein [Tanacetum cinerariifolium]